MCTCNIDQDLSEVKKWNSGGRMSGFPLRPDQVRLVLSLPVFAQPHDPGTGLGQGCGRPLDSYTV